MGTNRNLFCRTVVQKCRKVNGCSLYYGSWVAIQTKLEKAFGGFFQIKVRQPTGRKDSIQTVIRTSRRLDSWAAQNFEVFSNILKTKIKNQKPLAVDFLFQVLSNGTTLMQIQSGRTVPLKLSPASPVWHYFPLCLVLKVYSSHLNWGARLDSFDLMLNTRCPASFTFFFLMIQSHERSIKQNSAA